MAKSFFLGIDGCPAGWVAVSINGRGEYQQPISIFHETPLALEFAAQAAIALIDIPIGLVDGPKCTRRCDQMARQLLHRRRATIFTPPVRQALLCKSYAEACANQFAACGKKLSIQTWNIMPRIVAVDQYIRRRGISQQRLRESHPELCFRALNSGSPVASRKKTRRGIDDRRALLRPFTRNSDRFFEAALAAQPRRRLGADDLLDAMVLALSAWLGDQGAFTSLPDSPEYDPRGLRMEIVYVLPPGRTG